MDTLVDGGWWRVTFMINGDTAGADKVIRFGLDNFLAHQAFLICIQ